MEDSPQKIRHRRFATKKIRHTRGETYDYECDREFERKRRTNVCNSADAKDSPHNGDRLGSGGEVGSVGLGLGELKSGGGWVGVGGVGENWEPCKPDPPT